MFSCSDETGVRLPASENAYAENFKGSVWPSVYGEESPSYDVLAVAVGESSSAMYSNDAACSGFEIARLLFEYLL
jgi:hypothetical protein